MNNQKQHEAAQAGAKGVAGTTDIVGSGYQQELKRVLTLADLLVYGMIFMVPIAPFAVFGFLHESAGGMVPLAYLVGLCAMFFTAMSYWVMSREFPVAGSVYAYAQRGIHEVVGFFAGWLILMDYILVPALLYVISADSLANLFPLVPQSGWLLLFISINTGINLVGIEFSAKANRYILLAQCAVLLAFVVLGLVALYSGPAAKGLSLLPLYDASKFSLPLLGGAVSVAVLSFLGFDGISTLSEESQDGPDSVGRASVLTLVCIGALFILQTWIATDLARGMKFANPANAFYQTAHLAGGVWLQQICQWATILSFGIANAVVAQAAVSRILYAMARDKKLPAFLAQIHPTFKTPQRSVLLVSAISLVVGLLFIGKIDDLSRIVNFGAMCAFLILHLAVINHFMLKQRSRQWLRHLLFPLCGLLIIGYVLWQMDGIAKAAGAVWLGLGALYYAVLTVVLKRQATLTV